MRILRRWQEGDRKLSSFFLFFLSIFLMVGIGLSIYGGYMLVKSVQSVSWPTTEGVVKTAELKRRAGKKSSTYSAEIIYEYTVNGKPLKGNKIRMVKVNSSNSSNGREDLRRYATGTKVTVFYSPDDAADAVLEPGIHPSSWFFSGLGGVFMLFGAIGFVANFLQRKKLSAITEEHERGNRRLGSEE